MSGTLLVFVFCSFSVLLSRSGSNLSLTSTEPQNETKKQKPSDFLCIEGQASPRRQYDIVMPRSATISRLLRHKYYCNDSKIVLGLSDVLKPVVIGASKEQLMELFIEVGIAGMF